MCAWASPPVRYRENLLVVGGYHEESSHKIIRCGRARPQWPEGSLLSSRMRFALAGKNGVGPLVLFLRPSHSSKHWLRLDSPVRWRRLDTPDIPWLLQRDAHQPVIAPCSERYAVRHSRRRARSSRKFIEQNR